MDKNILYSKVTNSTVFTLKKATNYVLLYFIKHISERDKKQLHISTRFTLYTHLHSSNKISFVTEGPLPFILRSSKLLM